MTLSARWLPLLRLLTWAGVLVEERRRPEPLTANERRIASVCGNPFEPLYEVRGHADIAALGCLLGVPLRRGQA